VCLSVCVSVCLSVCPLALLEYLENRAAELHHFTHVACGRGSVVLWWRCDTICTSGFVDDVMLPYNGFYSASYVFL